MTSKTSKALQTLSLATTLLAAGVISCSEGNSFEPVASPDAGGIVLKPSPTATPAPVPECREITTTAGFTAAPMGVAELSVTWDEGAFSQNAELSFISENQTPVNAQQPCSKTANAAMLTLNTDQLVRGSLVVHDATKNTAIQFNDLVLRPEVALNLGAVWSQNGFAIQGTVNGSLGTALVGKIIELNKTFAVSSAGQWSTGPLPPGRWSVQLRNAEGKTLTWQKLSLGNQNLSLGAAELKSNNNIVTPLWSGVLSEPTARLLLSGEEKFTEMRIADNSAFTNSFWIPFRSVVAWPVSANGQQALFAEFRAPDGSISPTLVHQFRVELAGDLESADAVVDNPVSSMFEVINFNLDLPSNSPLEKKTIETRITTIPPAGATHHSVTVDVDDAPRQWVSTSTPIFASLSLSPQSCGRHHVYVRFKDSAHKQTASLRRDWNIRCWQEAPPPPLAPRFDHGATNFKFCFNKTTDLATSCSSADAVESEGIFIWGGRDVSQIFSDGAVLRKFKTGWRWDKLPTNSALTARINPKIAAGKDNILVWSGESALGDAALSYGIFKISTFQWLNSTPTLPTEITPLLHSTVAYIKHGSTSDGLPLSGMFIVLGGETKNPTTDLPSPSDKFAYLYESDTGNVRSTWENYATIPDGAISRSGYTLDASGRVLWVVSGLTQPTAASGTDPDLKSEIFAFVSGFETNGDGSKSPKPSMFRYPSDSSRVGALYGHVFVAHRYIKETTFATALDFIETMNPCIFGGQKYTDALPKVCEVIEVGSGQPKAYQSFCNRMYDSYYFAPVGKRSVCFKPASLTNAGGSLTKYMRNFFLPMQGAPSERRLLPQSTASFPEAYNPRLFYWSGVAAAGGEFLADGSIYELTSNKWIPITQFEAPRPRNQHTATPLAEAQRAFIFGGRTAIGASNEGVFYALP